MKRPHTVDKFGRYSGASAVTLDGQRKHVHVGNRRLRFVSEPVDVTDAVNKRYIQRYYVSNAKHNKLDKRIKDLQDELTSLKNSVMVQDSAKSSWDARGLKITNVGIGEKLEDVSRLSQTCSYDENVGNFKCGNRYFNLVETSANEPVVIIVSDTVSGDLELAEYKNPTQKLRPSNMIRWDAGLLVNGKGQKITWNETVKKFEIK